MPSYNWWSHHSSLSFTTFPQSCGCFLSVTAVYTVSTAYFMSLRLCSPVIISGMASSSHRISSVQRLNKSGENTHTCLPVRSTFVYLLNSKNDVFYPFTGGLFRIIAITLSNQVFLAVQTDNWVVPYHIYLRSLWNIGIQHSAFPLLALLAFWSYSSHLLFQCLPNCSFTISCVILRRDLFTRIRM